VGAQFPVTGSRAKVVLDNVCRHIHILVREYGWFNSDEGAAKDFFDSLLLSAIPIMPPCARPTLRRGSEKRVILHDYSHKYTRILHSAHALRSMMTNLGIPETCPIFTDVSEWRDRAAISPHVPSLRQIQTFHLIPSQFLNTWPMC
jgi:hypothetical protein